MKIKTKKTNFARFVYLFIFLFAVGLLFNSNKAEAATVSVGAGCTVNSAIISTNDDTDTGGCVGSGVYGADIINVPSGNWLMTASTLIEDDLEITGSGVATTTVDGDNSFGGFACNNTGGGLLDLSIHDLKIQNTVSSSGAYPIAAGNCNLDVTNVEITDGKEDSGNIFFTLEQDAVTANLNIDNVFIHDTMGTGLTILVSGDAATNVANVTVDRLTVTRNGVISKVMGGIGIILGDDSIPGTHSLDMLVKNSTFVNDDTYESYGIFAQAQSKNDGAENNIDVTLQNTTIINHEINGSFPGTGVLGAAYAETSGASASVQYLLNNVLLANNTANSSNGSCVAMPMGGAGIEVASITSQGNNISDDATCALAGLGDQENVVGLISSLGQIGDNGGLGETVALLSGSPAIDGGATIATITTDQRGISRPQGTSYDVGAFELEQTAPNNGGSNQNSGGSQQGNGNNNDSNGNNNGTSQGTPVDNNLGDTGENIAKVLVLGLVVLIFSVLLIIKNLKPKKRSLKVT